MPDAIIPARAPGHRSGVLFDVDGTLARSSSTHLQALSFAMEQVLGVAAVFAVDEETPYLNGARVAGFVDQQCIAHVAGAAGRDAEAVTPEILALYAVTYRDLLDAGASAGELLPGVSRLLDGLRAAGVPMGLSTGNASLVAQEKLTRLGIAHHFDFAASAGFGDHHRDRIAVAVAAAGVLPPTVTLYLVGDTGADMAAAQSLGAQGIGVVTGSATAQELEDAGASFVLSDVTEVDGLLGVRTERWFPRHVPGRVSAADRWMDHR